MIRKGMRPIAELREHERNSTANRFLAIKHCKFAAKLKKRPWVNAYNDLI